MTARPVTDASSPRSSAGRSTALGVNLLAAEVDRTPSSGREALVTNGRP